MFLVRYFRYWRRRNLLLYLEWNTQRVCRKLDRWPDEPWNQGKGGW